MAKKSYFEKLRDPRWQQMRLRIMEREGFMCEECGDGTTTLNVHHSYYEKGKDPWDYPEESLHCVCEPCHKDMEVERVALQRQIGRLSRAQHDQLLGFAKALELEDGNGQCIANSHEELAGMVRLFVSLSWRTINHCTNRLIPAIGADKVVTSHMLFEATEHAREAADQVWSANRKATVPTDEPAYVEFDVPVGA